MKTHELKIWPEPFEAVTSGRKNFEVRVKDRDYELGDVLRLQEYLPDSQTYTGREVSKLVTYIVHGGEWGLPKTLCVLGWSLEPPPANL